MFDFDFDKTERPKRMLRLSGEFLVVGELLRRGISASIPFGEDRSSHVILRNGNKFSFVEVITTLDARWTVRDQKDPGWIALILVRLPRDRSESPEFFIFSFEEIVELERAQHSSRIGAAPTKTSKYAEESPTEREFRLSSISLEEAEPNRGTWDKITSALGLPKGDWTLPHHLEGS
jgi:hypothetical protein